MFGGKKIIMKPINQTARITRISKRSCNKTCADCPEIHPTFVSIIKPQQCFALGSDALASFVCLQCASIHRKLGTDICFVRSINVDKWENKENDVNVADFTGNQIVNDIFEGHLKKALSNDANQSSAGTYSVTSNLYRERTLHQGNVSYDKSTSNCISTVKVLTINIYPLSCRKRRNKSV